MVVLGSRKEAVRWKVALDKRAIVAELHRTGEALRTEHVDLADRKKALRKEIAEMEDRRQRLTQEQVEIDSTREKLEAARATWKRSVSIWSAAAQYGAKFEKRDGHLVIVLQSGTCKQPKIVRADSVDPSVVILLRQKNALEGAMDATQQIADRLDEQKRLFSERNPDQKDALGKERREDKKRLQDAWASMSGRVRPSAIARVSKSSRKPTSRRAIPSIIASRGKSSNGLANKWKSWGGSCMKFARRVSRRSSDLSSGWKIERGQSASCGYVPFTPQFRSFTLRLRSPESGLRLRGPRWQKGRTLR